MARSRKTKQSEEENIGGSVQPSPYLTTGRRAEEKRLASGNTRRGAIAAKKAAAKKQGSNKRTGTAKR